MIPSASTFLIPAADATWRVWKARASAPSEAVDAPSHFGDRSKPVVVGLPATACRSVSLILPHADAGLMAEMVASQLERRGLKGPHGGPPAHRWHLLGNSGPHSIISVDVLAEPFPEDLAVSHAASYTSALRLVHLPAGQLTIVEEQGDLVIAANHHGKLQHSHVFAQRPADADTLAQEILLTKLALESQPGTATITGVTLIGEWDANLVSELRRSVGLTVQEVERLAPSSPQDTRQWTELLPPSVSQARADAASRAKWLRLGFLGALLYASLIFLGVVYLRSRQQVADDLAKDVAQTSAPAAEVRQTAERWKAMLPAIESRRFPLVILNQITALLPPSGIVFRDYEVSLAEVEVRGEARDAQTAFQLLEDLKKHKELNRYDWTMPQPQIRDNKTASFRLQGKLKP
jgi:hypothetical protein